jgi:hypothetical protein
VTYINKITTFPIYRLFQTIFLNDSTRKQSLAPGVYEGDAISKASRHDDNLLGELRRQVYMYQMLFLLNVKVITYMHQNNMDLHFPKYLVSASCSGLQQWSVRITYNVALLWPQYT